MAEEGQALLEPIVSTRLPGVEQARQRQTRLRSLMRAGSSSTRHARHGVEVELVVELAIAASVEAVALLLASDAGRGINGQGINVDGGSVFY